MYELPQTPEKKLSGFELKLFEELEMKAGLKSKRGLNREDKVREMCDIKKAR